jgi:hypothetical protein
MIQRCTQRPISFHQTRDAVSVSDAAASSLQVAMFRSGSRAVCQCQAGECAPPDCSALYIVDENDNHLATFHGKQFRVKEKPEGLCVYQLTPEQTRDSRAAITLADINRMGRELWKRPEIE